MNLPDSAREALFVEALGGMAQLIDRLESIAPAIDGARQAIVLARAELGDELTQRLTSFDQQMNAMTDAARGRVVSAVVTQVDAASRRALDNHKQELRQTAQAVFAEQVKLAIEGLTAASQRLAEQSGRARRDRWLTHGAAVGVTFMVTVGLSWSFWWWTAGR